MRRILVAVCCLIAPLTWTGCGPREEAKHEPPKFMATLHDEKGREKEETFDLAKPGERDRLTENLEEVHELKREEPLDLFGIKRWDLGLWSILIFITLFLVLTKFAWKPMIAGLRKREESIRGSLEQAEKTRRETMELQAQLDTKNKAAGAEIAKIMDEARREASGLSAQFLTDAKAEVQHERDRLLREIDTAKEQAMQEIRQQAIALAAAMSTKAVRRSMTEDDHRRLLDESLAELKEAGAGFGQRTVKGAGL